MIGTTRDARHHARTKRRSLKRSWATECHAHGVVTCPLYEGSRVSTSRALRQLRQLAAQVEVGSVLNTTRMPSNARFLLVSLLLDCCKPRDAAGAPPIATPSASISASTPSPPPSQRYTARGTVRSIDADKSLLWIAHDDIPGYMKAMTMPFVASAEIRRNLRPGDHVQFSFHDDGNGALIIESLTKRTQ